MCNGELCLVHSAQLKSSRIHTLKDVAYAWNNRLFSSAVSHMTKMMCLHI